MKKAFKIIGVIVVLIIAAMVVIPYFFKDKIVDKIKEEANQQLNAKLTFGDVDLTFFAHFPDLTLELENLSIKGIDTFEGTELINVESFELTLGLAKLFKGELPEIKGIYIHKATIHALVHPSGMANWDIVKEDTSAESSEESEASSSDDFSIQLNYYEFTDCTIRYEDESAATFVLIENLDHSGSGNFGANDFMLKTTSQIGNLLIEYEQETYVNNWAVEAKIDMDVNLDRYRFTLSENEVKLNELLLKAEGVIEMPDSAISMDLKIDAPTMTFRQLYSLLPPEYASDMDGMSFDGDCTFSTWIKGDYTDTTYPLFGLNLDVKNGSFKHKDLPKSAKNIEISTHIELPDANNLNSLLLDISKLNMDLGGNLISAGFSLRNPETSMDFTSRLSAAVDLSTLKDVLPSEDAENYSGIIKANLNASASLAALEKEDYSGLNAGGKLQVENVSYSSNQFSHTVEINKVLMEFMMDEVKMESFEAKIGSTDFSADGVLRDFIPYALLDKELYGELSVRSNYLNADELMNFMLSDSADANLVDSTANAENTGNDSLVTAMFPKNIHFKFRTGINTLKYDSYEINEFKGDLELKSGVLTIHPSSAKAFEGEMTLSGKIDESIPEQPYTELQFSLQDMNIKKCAEKVELIAKYAPIAKYTSGTFSGKVKMNSMLDKAWNPIYKTVYSKGTVKTKGVKIEGFELLDKLASITKMEDVLDQEFDNVDIEFEIIDGKGYIKPFNFKIDQLKGSSAGTIDLEQNIDFDVNMNVPTAMLGKGAAALFGQLSGALNSFGLQSEVPEIIEMDIKITGKVDKPIIKPNFAGLGASTVKEVVKETIKEEIEKAKDEALAKASEEAEKILADARKQADAILKEAQKNVDLLKKEGYEQADKLVKDAKGMLEQMAAKKAAEEMKKQVDKQAAKVMSEAKKQADKILEDAQTQADRLKN